MRAPTRAFASLSCKHALQLRRELIRRLRYRPKQTAFFAASRAATMQAHVATATAGKFKWIWV